MMRYGITPPAYWPINYFPTYIPSGGVYTLNAEGASYTETVPNVSLLSSLLLDASGGYYISVPYSASLIHDTSNTFVLVADPGHYFETGYPADLIYNNFLLLKYVDIPVYADSASVPLYWGPLTSAPASGYILNDYYFDAHTIAGGGGIIRYYNGTSWVEMLSSHPLYVEANWKALADMVSWAKEQATVIAAATAIVQKLVSSDAFIENLYALKVKIQPEGSIRGGDRFDENGGIDDIDSPGFYLGTDGTLQAKDAILSGYIDAQAGTFSASVDTPILKALLTSDISPWTAPSPSWQGSSFINAMSDLHNRGKVKASGTFNGKTVSAVTIYTTLAYIHFTDDSALSITYTGTYTYQGTIDPGVTGEISISANIIPSGNGDFNIGSSTKRIGHISTNSVSSVGLAASSSIVSLGYIHAVDYFYSFTDSDNSSGTWKNACAITPQVPHIMGMFGYWDDELSQQVKIQFAVCFGFLTLVSTVYGDNSVSYSSYLRISSSNLQFRNVTAGHVSLISGIKLRI